jgi:hypothetical protein
LGITDALVNFRPPRVRRGLGGLDPAGQTVTNPRENSAAHKCLDGHVVGVGEQEELSHAGRRMSILAMASGGGRGAIFLTGEYRQDSGDAVGRGFVGDEQASDEEYTGETFKDERRGT